MVKIYDYRQREVVAAPEFQPKEAPKDPLYSNRPRRAFHSPEEEKAYRIGLLVSGSGVALVILVFVLVFGLRSGNGQEAKSGSPQVSGAQTQVPAQAATTTVSPTPDLSLTPIISSTTTATATNTEDLTAETYTVKSGETLYVIGKKLNVDWRTIAEENNLEAPYSLKSGQKLQIPSAANIVKSKQ